MSETRSRLVLVLNHAPEPARLIQFVRKRCDKSRKNRFFANAAAAGAESGTGDAGIAGGDRVREGTKSLVRMHAAKVRRANTIDVADISPCVCVCVFVLFVSTRDASSVNNDRLTRSTTVFRTRFQRI